MVTRSRKREKAETMMFHLRIPVSLYRDIEQLSTQVAGSSVAGLGRELLQRAVAVAKKDPKRELIRDAS